jgi:hypothetical protein
MSHEEDVRCLTEVESLLPSITKAWLEWLASPPTEEELREYASSDDVAR